MFRKSGMVGTDEASIIPWQRHLTSTRSLKTSEDLENIFREHANEFVVQLREYRDALQQISSSSSASSKKELIARTRSALRFCAVCFQVPKKEKIQKFLVGGFDIAGDGTAATAMDAILDILFCPRGDATCRLLTARLLNNAVTSNSETARNLTSRLALCPSEEEVSDMIREQQLDDHPPSSGEFSTRQQRRSSTWTDLIIVNSNSPKNRDALGAIVAALHNCMAAIGSELERDVAQSSLLISTLLRHVVSLEQWQKSKGDVSDVEKTNNKNSPDAATEWIGITLGRLFRCGYLQQLYLSAGGSSTGRSCHLGVLPEQLTLLHCLQVEMMQEAESLSAEEASCQFLGELYMSAGSKSSAANEDDNLHFDLEAPLQQIVLDVLGERLGVDSSRASGLRKFLALYSRSSGGNNNVSFMAQLALDLGKIVDTLAVRNNGRKARDIEVHEEEQLVLTSLVRLLGNLCFQCRVAQDTMRTIVVPPQEQQTLPADGGRDRLALHVVLSCTSWAHSCFTLREWAVVAIRNMLDENEENRNAVAELEAQQPVQSAALDDLGVQVSMDPRGKVSVQPTTTKAKPEMAKIVELDNDGDR